MAKKKGICKNYDNDCSLCDNKVVQEVERDNFVCEECGGDLTEIDDSKKSSSNPKHRLIIIAIAIIVVIAICLYWVFSNKDVKVSAIETIQSEYTLTVGDSTMVDVNIVPTNATDTTLIWTTSNPGIVTVSNGMIRAISKGKATVSAKSSDGKVEAATSVKVIQDSNNTKNIDNDIEKKDSIESVEQNIEAENKSKAEPVAEPAPTKTPVTKPAPSPLPKKETGGYHPLKGTTFVGTLKGGVPHGVGRLIYKRTQRIDAHDEKERYANSGDYIIGEWYNGHLVQGKLFNNEGMIIGYFSLGKSTQNTDISDPYYQVDISLYK